jgi:hypothetical protein
LKAAAGHGVGKVVIFGVSWGDTHGDGAGAAQARRTPVRPQADAPNRVSDATTDGCPITLVSIIDELDRLALTCGHLAVLRCDSGYMESFNGRVRDASLNTSMNIKLSQGRARTVLPKRFGQRLPATSLR